MDFFEAQARAKKRTARLVFFFVLAVIATILALYLLLFAVLNARQGEALIGFDPLLFAAVSSGVLLVVGGSSLFKWSQLSSGGSAVAEMLGGRLVPLGTTKLRERILLNVVEEMAIASGTPVPKVYVLDEEPGINAFAAGLTGGDAVVAVTSGTLNKLNRDELQGVIAHEFSHILNGDMRLNVRLTAILFGILVLGLIGRVLLEGLSRTRIRSSGKGKDNSMAVLLVLGLGLMIIGYVGYFFGRLIQAAVSRQREYLADASAVQFTRNPAGIVGALGKIGRDAEGSTVESSKAREIGHFFFAQGFSTFFSGLFATHPPLEQRIKAIDPSWQGKIEEQPAASPLAASEEDSPASGFSGSKRRVDFQPAQVMANAGAITEAYFRQAQARLASIPQSLRSATQDPVSAQALLFVLLCAEDATNTEAILSIAAEGTGPAVYQQARLLLPEAGLLPKDDFLSLAQLTVPALRNLEASQQERLLAALDRTLAVDCRLSSLELALLKTVSRALTLARRPSTRSALLSFSEVQRELELLLSALAQAGSNDPKTQEASFTAALDQLGDNAAGFSLRPAEQCGMEALSKALDRLAEASLPVKKRLLVAAAHGIGADGKVEIREAELFRAVALSLDCPMPILG
jgi:Zn-dependent protease with chaperone function